MIKKRKKRRKAKKGNEKMMKEKEYIHKKRGRERSRR
jgi:hypothetical protein